MDVLRSGEPDVNKMVFVCMCVCTFMRAKYIKQITEMKSIRSHHGLNDLDSSAGNTALLDKFFHFSGEKRRTLL